MKDIYFYIIRPNLLLEKLNEKYIVCKKRLREISKSLEDYTEELEYLDESFYYHEQTTVDEKTKIDIEILIAKWEIEYHLIFKKMENISNKYLIINERYFGK